VVGEGITDNETLIIADVAHARLGPVRENWRNARAQNDPQKRRRMSKRGIYGNHDG
jgi:sulfite reductase beta subunit-like hemoprotein